MMIPTPLEVKIERKSRLTRPPENHLVNGRMDGTPFRKVRTIRRNHSSTDGANEKVSAGRAHEGIPFVSLPCVTFSRGKVGDIFARRGHLTLWDGQIRETARESSRA